MGCYQPWWGDEEMGRSECLKEAGQPTPVSTISQLFSLLGHCWGALIVSLPAPETWAIAPSFCHTEAMGRQ